jgi:hypothetical protein
MKYILKTLLILALFIWITPFSNAYNSEDYFNIYYNWNILWEKIYDVPEWYDLIINFLYTDNKLNSELYIADNYTLLDPNIIAWWGFEEAKNEVFLVIKDSLWLIDSSDSNNYTITGFLVSEDEAIQNYIEWNSTAWTKHIFDKEDIQFIYRREFIIFFILTAIRFISIIIGRPLNIF